MLGDQHEIADIEEGDLVIGFAEDDDLEETYDIEL